MTLTYILALVLVSALELTTAGNVTIGLINKVGKPFDYKCPPQMAISGMRSRYNTRAEDRRFGVSCTRIKAAEDPLKDCQWTGYLNDFGQALNYTCPAGVLSGLRSDYSDDVGDRRWKAYCCRRTGSFSLRSCFLSGYENDFNEHFLYNIPSDKVLAGIYTDRDNEKKDSRFNFMECTYTV